MRLYLVRHGRTANNVSGLLDTAFPGAPLDPVGLDQAAALVERLGGADTKAIYSSDIRRAVQTATPTAQARRVMVRPLPGLREIQAGDQELSPVWDSYVAVMRAWAAGDLGAMRPGGEDAHTFFGRYDAAIASIADAHDVAVAVSHGGAMRTWLSARVEGLDAVGVGHRHLGNTAIVTLEGTPERWELVEWDAGVHHDTPNLTPPPVTPDC